MTLREFLCVLKADLIRLSPKHPSGIQPFEWGNIFNPRFTPVVILRIARFCYLSRTFRCMSPVFTWLNVLLFGIEVTPRCEIGPGLLLPHTHGTVIGASRIGANAIIFQGVTLGAKYAQMDYHPESRPTVDDDVMIGAGAKVLGGINIGSRARIAANSLVIESVPPDSTVIGVPAIIKNANNH
ncbi:DapH/DapD/GlmU-related protein [Propionivibrio sp.]|uniref:serine O-acetyltransferase n=1 Tax=Propionivibrio sp. TaxID=2212460 RepID=UPI002606A431|nr:DapH/DapD/GlmU-related protein [Propionivibrio sp.]